MTIVQYILVRGDLLLREGWPVGAVLAQACHAATAAIHRLVLKQSRFAFEKQAAVLVIEHHIIVHLLAGLRAVIEGRI